LSRLAFFTFGIFRRAISQDEFVSFEKFDRILLLLASENMGCEGVASPLKDEAEVSESSLDYGVWGEYCKPRFFALYADSSQRPAQVLSVWNDIESVYKFAYSGSHAAALMKRREWFEPRQWPNYVCWWVGSSDYPTWTDACRRLELLYDCGSTNEAFDFTIPFDELGNRIESMSAS